MSASRIAVREQPLIPERIADGPYQWAAERVARTPTALKASPIYYIAGCNLRAK
jgi:hypothetical protein